MFHKLVFLLLLVLRQLYPSDSICATPAGVGPSYPEPCHSFFDLPPPLGCYRTRSNSSGFYVTRYIFYEDKDLSSDALILEPSLTKISRNRGWMRIGSANWSREATFLFDRKHGSLSMAQGGYHIGFRPLIAKDVGEIGSK